MVKIQSRTIKIFSLLEQESWEKTTEMKNVVILPSALLLMAKQNGTTWLEVQLDEMDKLSTSLRKKGGNNWKKLLDG